MQEETVEVVEADTEKIKPQLKRSLENDRRQPDCITFLCDGRQYVDTLQAKVTQVGECTSQRCVGSLMQPPKMEQRSPGQPRPPHVVVSEATDFIQQFYTSIDKPESIQHKERLKAVLDSIQASGTYHLTKAELSFGVKTAWRNASRCINRIQWSRLQLFDLRHVQTAAEMFSAICDHIRFGTNKGNIRSVITVFPQRTDGMSDFRVWNTQLIAYAGYRQADGSVIGDPIQVEMTELCQKMGWKANGGMFDVLPLILQANGQDPEMFVIPEEIVLEVELKHPRYPWFEELGYKWYSLPAVSCMLLDIGGLEFPGIPFNGWYMGTEIGTRDLCDPQRYNVTEKVAKLMGLDTTTNVSLWKDHALTAVNEAVLYSFNRSRVTITDHHSASASFMKHWDNEFRLRGGCPGDWVWVVPPASGSLCPVFHLEMLNYKLKPSYEYQPPAWKHHKWRTVKTNTATKTERKKLKFKDLANAIRLTVSMMGTALSHRIACTILYGTETGRSQSFAHTLSHLFGHAFNPKVVAMDQFHPSELEHECLVLFVTSTFGNGDPPENATEFVNGLKELKCIADNNRSPDDTEDNLQLLGNVRFSVFGLGSTAYPNFCAFAGCLDQTLGDLGGERIHALGKGDELGGQEMSFNKWANSLYKDACDTFMISASDTKNITPPPDHTWKPDKFRSTTTTIEGQYNNLQGLAEYHHKPCYPCDVISVNDLQMEESDNHTILVKLRTNNEEMQYKPGDHLGVFPENPTELVDKIICRLTDGSSPDDIVQLEASKEEASVFGIRKVWQNYRLPVCSLRQALTKYLDITTPPTSDFLGQLCNLGPSDEDRKRLESLSKSAVLYDDWRLEHYPGLVDTLAEFPSLRVPPTFLLTQLPTLKQRFYSISSSGSAHPGEIHLTVAVVRFHNKYKKHRFGVCSNWLYGLSRGDSVPAFIRSAKQFHMPEDTRDPIVMVGPGTGIAPFRSFWQQRAIDIATKKETEYGSMHLYFGCRNSKVDNIYQEERAPMLGNGVLSSNHTALSREPGMPKVYAQNLLTKNGSEVYRMLSGEDGHLYVCGDVAMANGVAATVIEIARKEGCMTQEDAVKFMANLKATSRYHEDIFGVTLKTKEVTAKARTLSRQKTLMDENQ